MVLGAPDKVTLSLCPGDRPVAKCVSSPPPCVPVAVSGLRAERINGLGLPYSGISKASACRNVVRFGALQFAELCFPTKRA